MTVLAFVLLTVGGFCAGYAIGHWRAAKAREAHRLARDIMRRYDPKRKP